MEVRYYKEYSRYLNRDMEFKVYGNTGRPCLIFPCQSGRFYDWENFGMCNLAAPWVDSGKLQLFTADSIDRESWDCPDGDPRHRIEMQERWFNYICEELVPRIIAINRENGGQDNTGNVLLAGTSMGAGHAVNLFLRRPDLFNGTIALSGNYKSEMFFGSYMDDLVYRNSPVDYLAALPADHPCIDLYNQADRLIVCVGQGDWEEKLLASTRELKDVFDQKGIHADVEIWGTDVSHDWPWWQKQWVMFLGRILGNV